MSAKDFNRPQSGNEIINSKGHKLHFRIEWQNFDAAEFVVFYIPGYSGHINRTEMSKMTNYMNNHGAVVVALDMQGHGYSEGERCLMLDHEDLLGDVLQLVDAIMNNRTSETLKFDSNPSSFQREHLPNIQKLPFFIMGSSMGGAISSMVGHRLFTSENKIIFPTFKGSILLAPALSFKTPNWLLVETLR